MKISVCSGIENIKILGNLGIDEIELSASWISQLSEKDFMILKKSLDDSAINADVCNCLMQSDVVHLFQDKNYESTTAYLNHLIPRLAMLKVEYIVFGSGNYRKVPENILSSENFQSTLIKNRISDFLLLLSDITAKFNITIVIEPLNHNETNVILTSSEAMKYINKLKRDNISLLIDLYHFDLEKEDFTDIVKYKDFIKHIHISKPVKRSCPAFNDGYDYNEFFKSLKAAEYDGIISIEASVTDFAKEIAEAKILIESFMQVEK